MTALFEEIVCIQAAGVDTLVVVGHSQGGAAVAQVCTERVCRTVPLRGLFMIGAESPLELDGQDWTPATPHTLLVHAEGDRVIHPSSAECMARTWNTQLVLVPSAVAAGAKDCWGDDINHDFLGVSSVCVVLCTAHAILKHTFAAHTPLQCTRHISPIILHQRSPDNPPYPFFLVASQCASVLFAHDCSTERPHGDSYRNPGAVPA